MRWILPLLYALTFVYTPFLRGADAPAAAPGAAETQALMLTIELADGSRIIGAPAIDRVKLIAVYASLDMQLSMVRSVEFNAKDPALTAQVRLQNGDLLSAKLDVKELAMKTIFGKVQIPLSQMRRLRVSGGSGKVFPDGLVLHYSFDADEPEKVNDDSGADNHGTLRGATYAKDGGKSGSALSLDGNRQAVILKNAESLQMQDFTIMAWVKRANRNNISKISVFGQIFGYGRGGYIFGVERGGRLYLCTVGRSDVRSDCLVDDEEWHHVAVTKKGSKVVFFLDGKAFPAPDYDTTFSFDTDVAVGGRPDNLNETFLGLIDEVMVFKRVLTEDEVKGICDSLK